MMFIQEQLTSRLEESFFKYAKNDSRYKKLEKRYLKEEIQFNTNK